MNIKKIFVFIVTFFAIFILLACGKPDTLEEVMSGDVAQNELSSTRSNILLLNGEAYSDYSVEISGNKLTYKYYFNQYSDEELSYIKEALEADDSQSETIITIKDEIEQSCAIRPDSVTFVYYTADGQELFTITN